MDLKEPSVYTTDMRALVFGLLVAVALFGAMFLAPNASATVICGNSSSPCLGGDAYPTGTELNGSLSEGSASFVGEKNTLKCGSSSIVAKTTAPGTPLAAQVTALSFSGCELGCTVSAQNLPYKAEIEYAASGDGVMALSSGGSGPPRLKNNCSGLSCTFGASKLSLDVDGGSPAEVKAVSEPLVREVGEKAICGDTATWSTVFRISEPMALFVQSREAPAIALCAAGTSPCSEGAAYPLGTELKGALSEGLAGFTSDKEPGTLYCSSSTITGKITAAGTPMAGQISALSFSGCSLACTVSALHLPYKAEIETSGSGDGVLTLRNGGSGTPQIRNTCFGKSCTFGSGSISLDIGGGNPATVRAINEPLTREEGEQVICGNIFKWSAVYGIAEPKALFVEPAGKRQLYFGISANTRTDGVAAQELAAETGVDRLREDLEWAIVEPSDDNWQWAATDTLFETAAERGMGILPILNTSPCWAVPKEVPEAECQTSYPVSDAEYAEFAAHVAARYGPAGDFWDAHPELDGALASVYLEIWNEPYIEYFTNGEIDPARYTTLYKAAVIAGRNANPATRYLVESTSDRIVKGNLVNWAGGMVKAESSIGNYIDGIAIHPYPDNRDPYFQPTNGLDAAFKKTDRIYNDWTSRGIKRPIWITEVGYSSCTDPEVCVFGETQANRETLKAQWLADMLAQLGTEQYSYVHAVYLYNLRQWEGLETPPNKASYWYGILDGDEEQLPAWSSFSDAVEQFDGTPTGHALILGGTIAGANATFTFTLTDPTATASCQLDAGAWTTCTTPKSYSGLGGGSHTFRVRATNAEATEASPATYSW
jgi:hypothetical protein